METLKKVKGQEFPKIEVTYSTPGQKDKGIYESKIGDLIKVAPILIDLVDEIRIVCRGRHWVKPVLPKVHIVNLGAANKKAELVNKFYERLKGFWTGPEKIESKQSSHFNFLHRVPAGIARNAIRKERYIGPSGTAKIMLWETESLKISTALIHIESELYEKVGKFTRF